MKKIIYILTAFAAILVGVVIANKKTIDLMLLKSDMEKDAINLLNDFDYKTKYFADDVDELIYKCSKTIHRYDITSSVEEYLYKIDKCYRMKKFNEDFNDTSNRIYNKKPMDRKKYNYCYTSVLNQELCKFATKTISKKQLEEYEPTKLRNDLIDRLKKKFKFEDDRWIYEGEEKKKIDLQYGVYIGFTPDEKKTRDDIKKYIKINLKCPLEDLRSEGDKKEYIIPFELTYIDKKNKKHIESLVLPVSKRKKNAEDNQYIYSYKLSSAISKLTSTNIGKISYLTFGQYDFDDDLAFQTALEEEDLSTISINQSFKDIEMFKKYNQFAEIIVVTYKDDSKKSFFRKSSDFITEDGKKHVEYMERELPYKNKSIDEVMELYVNDKEQYIIDEELLKGNPPLVEYKSRE